MKILCDMDGVVGNIMVQWLKWYNEDYHDDLKEEDVTEWEIDNFVKPEAKAHIFKYLNIGGFFRSAVPYPDAKVGIRMLLNMGSDVWFVTKSTARAQSLMPEKMEWVDEHYPTIGHKKIIFCQQKSMVNGDMMIDDYVKNFEGFEGARVLFSRPWNQHVTMGEIAKGCNAIALRASRWESIIGVARQTMIWKGLKPKNIITL